MVTLQQPHQYPRYRSQNYLICLKNFQAKQLKYQLITIAIIHLPKYHYNCNLSSSKLRLHQTQLAPQRVVGKVAIVGNKIILAARNTTNQILARNTIMIAIPKLDQNQSLLQKLVYLQLIFRQTYRKIFKAKILMSLSIEV